MTGFPSPEMIRAHAAPPFRRWARHGIPYLLYYVRSRLGDHGRLPPLLRLIEITDQLYLGGQIGANDWRRLTERGVSAIVNMRVEWDDRRFGIDTPHALWLPVIDGTAATVEQLYQGVCFIGEQISAGHGVYVHCAAGFGRGPSQVVAYLIACGFGVEDAIIFVADRRPVIHLSARQRMRLHQFADYWAAHRP